MPLPALLCLCAAAASAGRYRLAGLFPLHGPARLLGHGCDDSAATFSSHGYCLSQTMRFAVEEINNSSALLPNVTLGCDIRDTCSEPANLHATLRALVRKGGQEVEVPSSFHRYEPDAVAVIGPDSTHYALTTASVLGVFLVPSISYEASLETLSLKRFYPSFLRTIPSDGQQVKAVFQLLQHFGWTWVVLLGSNNDHGKANLEALYTLLTRSDICVAYRGTIPTNKDASNPELHRLVRIFTDARVNVTIVFSDAQTARSFFEVVVKRNVTGMVWVGSEDWVLAQAVWQVPGIQSIGSVIAMSIERAESTMLERFVSWKMAEEGAVAECATEKGEGIEGSAQPNCSQCGTDCHWLTAAHSMYDAQSSFRVYSAVYAVAHGLHDLLGCASGMCREGPVYPWQLLQKIRHVNFTLYKSHISFDASGDIRQGYDIVMWNWSGPSWAFGVIGSFHVNPYRLSIDNDKIPWHTEDGQAPTSMCTEPCQPGERQLQLNHHRCCFSCVACPSGTFLNRSDLYSCQQCGLEEWAPERSEVCFNRTVEFLPWSGPMSWALLTPTVLLMLLMAGLAVLFALNASTPVVKSAGGKMCFLMLGALACACSSLLGYFGEPTQYVCQLQRPLYVISLTIFLSCVATRSFQIVCIFKLNARWPALYEAWLRRRGPVLFVAASTLSQAVLCAALEAADPSVPRRDYGFRAQRVVLRCAPSSAVSQATTAYTVLLSAACFALSYAGKDLPDSYNEAKCLTCSLLLHLAGSAVFLSTQDAFSGREQAAVQALSTLGAVAALLAGFFLPKAFVILLRPHRNTPEHFQEAIQRYTRRLTAA